MPKYRKKAIVVEAEQWFPGKRIEGVIESPVLEPTTDNPSGCYGQIKTLEGWMTCIPGDWIITGVKGEKYPCKPDIFKATYEEEEDYLEQQARLTDAELAQLESEAHEYDYALDHPTGRIANAAMLKALAVGGAERRRLKERSHDPD